MDGALPGAVRDHRVVDRLAEFKALAARSAPMPVYATSTAAISVNQAPTAMHAKSPKKSLMGRLFGGDSKEDKKSGHTATTSAAPQPQDNSAALEKYFAEVETVMIAIHEAQATLDSLEPQCIAILAELFLYKDEQERSEAVERHVVAARRQLTMLQDTMRKFLGLRVPAEHLELCQRWRSFTAEKCGTLYTYFLDRVAKLRGIMRERRRRQLLIADPRLREEELTKRLDSSPFEIFTTASIIGGLSKPSPPERTEADLQWLSHAP